tara:strand:- start:433 stop:1158 length:726 start_codon:yes stop_codon:yes gene_type:complete
MDDPMMMSGLDPAEIANEKAKKGAKPSKAPSEAELAKEARLQAKEQRLAAATAPAPKPAAKPRAAAAAAPPAPAPPPLEHTYDKSYLIDRIEAYRERFPQLKKRNNVSAKSTLDELLDELHSYEKQLGSGNKNGGLGPMLLHGSMCMVEAVHRDVWNPFGLNLTGLGQVTKDNMDQFEPIVDELLIKYGSQMYLGPEMRLCLALGSVILTVHGANSGDPRIANALNKMNQQVKVAESTSDL